MKSKFFFTLCISISLSAQDLNEKKILAQEASLQIVNSSTNHYSETLHDIFKYGYLLSDSSKEVLEQKGFVFNKKLTSSARPQNLDQYTDDGFFRFHYTLQGSDAVSPIDSNQNQIPDYIDLIITTFKSIGNEYFEKLGYPRPPSDHYYTRTDNGGSDHYDIYIFNLESGYYGYVQAENYANAESLFNKGDNEFSLNIKESRGMTTFMALRNNYKDFSGNEKNIIEVTSAHEFFHAIQYGYDGWEAGWLLESTAVFMEEFLYDSINDCYQFLKTFLEKPELSINHSTDRGYGSYIYFSYLDEHYVDRNFVKKVFVNSVSYDSYDQDYSLRNLKEVVLNNGLSFENTMHNFFIANAILDSSSSLEKYRYEEAPFFPIKSPTYKKTFSDLIDSSYYFNNQQLESGSSLYYSVDTKDSNFVNLDIEILSKNTNSTTFRLTTIFKDSLLNFDIKTQNIQKINVANTEKVDFLVSAFNMENKNVSFDFKISKNSQSLLDSTKLAINMINNPKSFTLYENYPNPFNPNTTLRFDIPENSDVTISIYNMLGQKVKNFNMPRLSAGYHSIQWDGTNQSGVSIGAGVYFYQLQTKNIVKTSKMTLLK